MQNKRTKAILILLAFVCLVIVLAVIIAAHNKHTTTNKSGLKRGAEATKQNLTIPASSEAFAVVEKYVEAREDALGADQSSPTSWLSSVQAITTPAWFNQLQPTPNSPTNNVPNNYFLARQNGYVVKANVSDCIWNVEIAPATSTSGVVSCTLDDTTVSLGTTQPVAASSLPFGWTYEGTQLPPTIELVKQGNTWLVSNDSTGDGD